MFLGLKRGWCVLLTTCRHLGADCLNNVWFLTSHNPYRPPPSATVIALLFTFTSKTQTRNVTKKCRLYSFINIIILIIALKRPPLWSSGQSSWLQIQRSGFNSRRYPIIWVVVGLERGPLCLVSTTEELLERKSSGYGLEIRQYGRRDRHAGHVAPSIGKAGTNFA
jgi:hypothetical protein